MMQVHRSDAVILSTLVVLTGAHYGLCQEPKPGPRKTFIDYFLPMPIQGSLSNDARR
jgi:hypothetical protein